MQGRLLQVVLVLTLRLVVQLRTVTSCTPLNGVCHVYLTVDTKCLTETFTLCSRVCNSTTLTDTTSIIWYRCEGIAIHPQWSAGLCKQRQVINSSQGEYVIRQGRLCFKKFNKTYAGFYCYETMPNCSCSPVQVLIQGTLLVRRPAMIVSLYTTTSCCQLPCTHYYFLVEIGTMIA